MRASVLLALVAVLALASGVQAQVRSGLCVGAKESPVPCDVVNNGVVQPLWVDGTNSIPAGVQVDLQITLSDGAPAPSSETVTVTYSAVDGATNAVWMLPAESNVYGNGWNTPLNGTLLCQKEQMTGEMYSIKLEIAGYTPLIIQFTKMCILPRFDIGSFPHGDDIMLANVVQPFFPAYIVTQNEPSYDFHVYLSDNDQQKDPDLLVQKFSLEVVSAQPELLTVSGSWDSFTMNDTYFENEILASFTCAQTPDVAQKITVSATLKNFGWTDANDIAVKFFYVCGKPLPGLIVGRGPGASDVAANGVTVAPWNSSYVFPVDSTYDFVLFFESTQVNTKLPWYLNIVSQDPNALIINPTSPLNDSLVWVEGHPMTTVFLAEIICSKDGGISGLVQLFVGDYLPIQMQFLYTCSTPLFNIGTSAGASDMVSRGTAQMQFSNNVVHSDRSTFDIFVQLAADNVASSNGFGIEAIFDKNILSNVYDYDRLNATADKNAARSAANPVTLHFDCLPCITAHRTQVTLSFPWGWLPQQSVVFYKDCVAAPSCHEEKHHGMTAAGTAALVIFFLAFGACVAGCAYNKFSQHKSGWAVVPGATSAAHCFDSVSTGGRNARWTPQEHDDAGLHSSANYNASSDAAPLSANGGGYQSYSSNL